MLSKFTWKGHGGGGEGLRKCVCLHIPPSFDHYSPFFCGELMDFFFWHHPQIKRERVRGLRTMMMGSNIDGVCLFWHLIESCRALGSRGWRDLSGFQKSVAAGGGLRMD